uniref:Mitochondrial dicarboxylate/tricarboxylate transporter DTC n=1 Tax=Davidia involucrata TaxID=16924 RepID=A0A5B7BHA4_DAVIN
MDNLSSLPSGYSNDMNIVNQELQVEEKPTKPLVKSAIWPTVKPFVNGGLAGLLTASERYVEFSLLHYLCPLLAKAAGGPAFASQIKKAMLSRRSCSYFFKSMPVHLLLEATLATARFGSFEILTKKAEAANDGTPMTLYQEACCGLTSGAIGAIIGTPIFLASTRMRADAALPAAQQLHYRNVFHALYHTAANEGVLALWKGAGCYANAAIAFNMGMLASYNRSSNYFKESLGFGEYKTRLGAGAVSGFFASACALPYINVRGIMRVSQPDANGKYPFTNSLDCAWKILKSGGPFKFYTGFPKYFVKATPNVMVTWIILEEIKKFEESIGL